MKTIMCYLLQFALLLSVYNCVSNNESSLENSAVEKRSEWVYLFDGEKVTGLRGIGKVTFPEQGWSIENGELVARKGGKEQSEPGGDVISEKKYSDFELSFEFRLTEGANGGIKYLVKEYKEGERVWAIGCEYQIVDDLNHPVVSKDDHDRRKLASFYEMFSAQNRPVKPVGEWNSGKIVVNGKTVEHWLNGAKVLQYERGSPAFEEARLKSKFEKYPEFGILEEGHILIQDHGDEVRYRNIKIREL